MSKYIDELTELICDVVRTVFPNASLDDGYDVADEVIAKIPTIEVSEDCIDRYATLAELDPRSYEYKAIKELPSVVPNRAEGEWQLVNHLWECNRCQYRQNKSKPTNYCPNCGAKMKGTDDE